MTLLTAAVIASLLTVEDSAEFAPLYWHESVGVGFQVGSAIHNDGVLNQPGATGTNEIQAFSLSFVSTAAYRLQRTMAIGGQLQLGVFPWVQRKENRREGYKERSPPFGVTGVFGPSLILFPGALRFDATAGFFWVVTAAEPNHKVPGFGGTGPGLSVAGAYDLALNDRLALALEARAIAGFDFNGDSTHVIGMNFGLTVGAGIRRR